ncbi:hypothetical protein ACFQ0M_11760 [Kitasatospora aburaviensis]
MSGSPRSRRSPATSPATWGSPSVPRPSGWPTRPRCSSSRGQTAGLLASMAAGDAPEAVMLLGGVSDVRFHRPVHPGVVLEHRIRVALAMNDTTVFEGETLVDGEPVLSVGRMTIAYRPWDTIPIEGFGPLRSPAPAAETAAIPAQRDR